MSIQKFILAAVVGLLATRSASAQFLCAANCHLVSGNVSDATTGAFLPGHTYIATANLTVPSGATLTVGAGAIVKFNGTIGLSVLGTLTVNGTVGSEAIFTTIHDDVGGDNNNNGGATVPAAGQWGRITFASSSDASVLNGAIVRYAGAGGLPALELTLSNLALTNCTVTSVAGACLSLAGNSLPTVTSCAFNSGTLAVASASIASLAGFFGCTASGNSTYDAIQVTAATVAGSVAVSAANALNADGVFVAANTITIPAAATLTLGSGVNFKFTGVFVVDVDGTLIANGTPSAPVTFTSIHDDVVGGDTNKNGVATLGAPGQWSRIDFASTSDASALTDVVVRCAGAGGISSLDLSSADVSLTSVSTALLGGPCLNLTSNSFPTVVGCAFNGGTKAAINVPLGALPGFSGNTAAGNSQFDVPEVTSATVSGALALEPDDTFNGDGTLVISVGPLVASAGSLSLAAGMKFKFSGSLVVNVDGVLTASGTPGMPVVFTSIHDDAHGGDTNKNGAATVAAAGQWNRIDFAPTSDASSLTHAVVRCAGQAGNDAIDLDAANVTLTGVSTDLLGGACLKLTNNSFPTVSGCAFNGGTRAVVQVPIHALPGFVGCTASGNSLLNAHRVESGTTTGSLSINAANAMNGAGVFVFAASANVSAGTTLTLGAGTIVKFDGVHHFVVDGTLVAAGVAGSPVVMTSIHDDAFGGDTNLNAGGSTAAPGQWLRLLLNASSDASTLDFLVVRAAGASGLAAVEFSQSDATLRDVETAILGGPCLGLGLNSKPNVVRCALNGGSRPVDNARIDSLAGFRFCTAAGNSVENSPRLVSATLGAGLTASLDRINSCNADGVFVVAGPITVAIGATLNVGRGVRFKLTSTHVVEFSGTVNLNGTGRDPVVFTSIHDDTIGGDTNLNGSTTFGAAFQLTRIRYIGSAAGIAENVLVRFGGSGGNPGFECQSSGVTLRSVRAENCAADGLRILDAAGGVCDNLVAWNNGGDGIEYDNSVSLRHPTSAFNFGVGIRGLVATPGTVVSGVMFGNSASTASVPATQVSFSCGVAGGGSGNFVADPLFVDGPNGDLSLQLASPCVDTGDALTGFLVTKDHVEASRLSDGKLLGTPFPDMGAYELAPYTMTVAGEPWSNTVVTIEVVGPPGIAAIAVGNLFGTELLIPYGFSLADTVPFLVPFVFVPANTPFMFPMPDVSTSAGVPFGMQALATTFADPSKGGFTNLYRAELDG